MDAVYYGTAVFGVVDGRPRLRMFSNQQAMNSRQNDFTRRSLISVGIQDFWGFIVPKANGKVSGLAELALVDQDGNVKNMSVVYEYPPEAGLAMQPR